MKDGEQFVHSTWGICTFIKMINRDTAQIKTNSGVITECKMSDLRGQLIFS